MGNDTSVLWTQILGNILAQSHVWRNVMIRNRPLDLLKFGQLNFEAEK